MILSRDFHSKMITKMWYCYWGSLSRVFKITRIYFIFQLSQVYCLCSALQNDSFNLVNSLEILILFSLFLHNFFGSLFLMKFPSYLTVRLMYRTRSISTLSEVSTSWTMPDYTSIYFHLMKPHELGSNRSSILSYKCLYLKISLEMLRAQYMGKSENSSDFEINLMKLLKTFWAFNGLKQCIDFCSVLNTAFQIINKIHFKGFKFLNVCISPNFPKKNYRYLYFYM